MVIECLHLNSRCEHVGCSALFNRGWLYPSLLCLPTSAERWHINNRFVATILTTFQKYDFNHESKIISRQTIILMKRHIMNRFIKYKICASLWKLLLLTFICIVVVLELTRWRPFGFSDNAKNINNLLLTLSYSIIGANLFYLLNEYLPSLSKRYVTQKHVERQLRIIKEQLRLLVEVDLHPFAFEPKDIVKDNYVAEFENTNLHESAPFNKNISKEDFINKRKNLIAKISSELLSSYLNILTREQLNFLDKILKSTFVNIVLSPALWTSNHVPIGDDNQKEISESIYELYKYSRSF